MSEFNEKLAQIVEQELKNLGFKEKKPKYIPKRVDKLQWEIRKRSLPPGIDQVIIGGLSKTMAIKIHQKQLPKHKIENGQVIYYDIVRENGYKSGIFDNDLPSLTKEETQEDNHVEWKD